MKEVKLRYGSAEKNADMFITELTTLKTLGRHGNLPYLHVAFVEGRSCYLCMDYINGGDLRYHINHGKGFTIEQTSFIIGSLGMAIHHLERHGMIHRDIKPENVILDARGHPVLVDLGISYIEKNLSAPLCASSSGTIEYLAPEVLTTSHRHSVHADFWSLGIIMHELLFGRRPFDTHCWKSLIYFSENHYTHLWDTLETMHSTHTTDLNWCELSYLTEDDRLRTLRFPDYDIPLEFDGSLPECLRVPVPPTTWCGQAITAECADLLSGLLDVRIPERLGMGKMYSTFINHSLFLTHGHEFGRDLDMTPPFVPDAEQVASYLQDKYAYENMLVTVDACEDGEVLNQFVQEKLRGIKYMSPEFREACSNCTFESCYSRTLSLSTR